MSHAETAKRYPRRNEGTHRHTTRRFNRKYPVWLVGLGLCFVMGTTGGISPAGASESNPQEAESYGGKMESDKASSGTLRPTAAGAWTNEDWWPNRLNLNILHQNPPMGNPLGEDFNYAEEFKNSILLP